jgi:hypothetical protein
MHFQVTSARGRYFNEVHDSLCRITSKGLIFKNITTKSLNIKRA